MTVQAEAQVRRLPEGFAELEQFVDRWAGDNVEARVAAREESSMEAIEEFYEAMLARADDAAAIIDLHDLHDLPEDVGTLCKLLLGLAHAASAVEFIGAPRVKAAPYPTGVRVLKGPQPFG